MESSRRMMVNNVMVSVQELNTSFRRVSAMVVQGSVKPLPALVYPFDQLQTALRQFSTAKHVGKAVVEVGSPVLPASTGPNGAWLVTGGLGALGSLAAGWLVGQGARNIHLLGRSGRYGMHYESVLQLGHALHHCEKDFRPRAREMDY